MVFYSKLKHIVCAAVLVTSVAVAQEAPTVSLTVDEAVAYADANSRTLKSSALDLEIKKRAADLSWNQFLPSVNMSATVNRSNKVSSFSLPGMPDVEPTEADHWTAVGSVSIGWNFSFALVDGLRIIKKNYDVHYNKAVAHHLRGEYREAGLEYCEAIQLEPMKFEAHYNLAVLLRQLNRHRDSINELHKAAILILEEPDSSPLESTYIFNLLNDATRKFISSDEYYTEKLTDEPLGNISYTYVNGRIVPDEEFDKAILKNFKTCAGFEYFNEEEPE